MNELEEKVKELNLNNLALEEENRNLRDQNFDYRSKSRIVQDKNNELEKQIESNTKQYQIMTDQNSELLRLLESVEEDKLQLNKKK